MSNSRLGMSIKVYLYGDLRDKNQQGIDYSSGPSKTTMKLDDIKTVRDVMVKFNIKEQEISHIFVNSKYCGPGKEIKDGDRVGIFPKKMAINFIEIATNNIIFITVKFFANLRKYGPPKAVIRIPEGSSVYSVLKKYNIPLEKENVKVMVNGHPHIKTDFILSENDVVAIFPLLAGG